MAAVAGALDLALPPAGSWKSRVSGDFDRQGFKDDHTSFSRGHALLVVEPSQWLLEVRHAVGKVEQRGYTLVPTQMYLKHGRAKVELGLARGKREYDKREAISKREAQREIERGLSDRRRGRD